MMRRHERDRSRQLSNLLHRLPEWIRSDLGAKDPGLRTPAEEALAAMIMSELSERQISHAPDAAAGAVIASRSYLAV